VITGDGKRGQLKRRRFVVQKKTGTSPPAEGAVKLRGGLGACGPDRARLLMPTMGNVLSPTRFEGYDVVWRGQLHSANVLDHLQGARAFYWGPG